MDFNHFNIGNSENNNFNKLNHFIKFTIFFFLLYDTL